MYIVSLTYWKNEYTIGNRWLLGVYFFLYGRLNYFNYVDNHWYTKATLPDM